MHCTEFMQADEFSTDGLASAHFKVSYWFMELDGSEAREGELRDLMRGAGKERTLK